MAQNQKILVTGATGHQGGAVARQLLAHGHTVIAMTRKPNSEKAKALAKLGAEIVQADLDDPASFQEAASGVWGAFAVQNTWEAGVEKEEQQGKRFAEVCRKAGVQHFVYSSVGSAQRNTGIPHFDNKWRIEQTVRSLDFPSYTIIRPVFFMENFLSAWFKAGIDAGKLVIALKPDTLLQMIAVEDIGKFGAWAFEEHKALNGRAIDIAGDECTMPEAAKAISSASGKKVEFVRMPIEEVRKSSEDYAIMLEWFDAVGYDVDIDAVSRESGIQPLTFNEWALKVYRAPVTAKR